MKASFKFWSYYYASNRDSPPHTRDALHVKDKKQQIAFGWLLLPPLHFIVLLIMRIDSHLPGFC
jgi:hypothetical protein